MKRIGNLWPGIVRFDNLLLAFRKARKGKAKRAAVLRFELNLERELLDLQQQLIDHSYQPGEFRLFNIYDRKPRQIAAAPFRDRVVHHALMNQLEPALDRRLIHDCHACRKDHGTHLAVRRYQHWSRRYAWALKVDIQKYFPSIDHQRLKQKLRRLIKDAEVLWLLDRIIDHAPDDPRSPVPFPGDDLVSLMQSRCGLPIGNLTSQLLANLYLNDFDHFVKEQLRMPAYLRYVDDMILLHDDKQTLWDALAAMSDFLATERLRLHPDKLLLVPVERGLDVLGYRVWPDRVRLRNDSGYRFRRRLRAKARAWQRREITLPDVRASVRAWLGHIRHAQAQKLCASLLGSVSFKRGDIQTERPACASRRVVEQQTGEPPVREPQQEQHR